MEKTMIAPEDKEQNYPRLSSAGADKLKLPPTPVPLRIQLLSLKSITKRLAVRRLSPTGIARLKESIQKRGFLESFPLLVTPLEDGTYQLIAGNHRYEAAQALSLAAAPCLLTPPLTVQEQLILAWQSNYATETLVPSTLVTYAEFIWARLESGETQQAIAEVLGWSREKVKDYAALHKICPPAWEYIGATFEKTASFSEEGVAPTIGATAPFTERLLREILLLTPAQQMELVTELATNEHFGKGKFKVMAEKYRGRNEMLAYALQHLGDVGEELQRTLTEELTTGAYDADWKTPEHPRLHKLLAALRDEWERKHSIHLLQGDFAEESPKLGDGCIDLILTDPPYNIAREYTFELTGRSTISQDFGPWDKHNEQEFVALFTHWAREWARLLREQGSGYVFTSDRTLSHLRAALEKAGLHVKATIVWHKTNPGPQIVKTNFRSSIEYLLFFTKGEGGHTFHWQGEQEMHNFIESPVCSGKERLVDAKGNTLHPTQKPEHILQHFLEISSNRGDMVLDCFAGVGSTGAVAKRLGRKFIGIEQDPIYFAAMQRRLAE